MRDRRNYIATSNATCTQSGLLAALLQQIHDDLRVQHPEWVQPSGDCPICDSYEARLTELLGPFDTEGEPNRNPQQLRGFSIRCVAPSSD
jgi:hypothetical protein